MTPAEDLVQVIASARTAACPPVSEHHAAAIAHAILANPDVVLRALGVPFRIQPDGTIITLVTELKVAI